MKKQSKLLNMKKFSKLLTIVALVAMGMTQAWGQEVAMPANFQQHGNTSAGIPSVPASLELTDSVTINSSLQYWVQPDAAVLTDPSTFTWGTTIALASQTAGGTSNLATFNFTAEGTGNITVREDSPAPNSCTGSTTTIPVRVIAAPDVTAATFSSLACPAGTDGTYTLAGPTATLTIACSVLGNKGVSLHYSLSGPTGFTTVGSTLATLGNGNTIDLSGINLTHSGTYTLTIIDITDRIATKSGLLTIADGTTATFVVNRVPVTGPVYHLPNN